MGADDVEFLVRLNKEELAAEMSAWLRQILPVPDELAKFEDTRASAIRSLRHILKESNTGSAIVITPLNVTDVIQHHE